MVMEIPAMFKFVKIAVYVPKSHAGKIRQALMEGGAGKIGNYDSCSFSVTGTGRFRPKEGAKPFVGKLGEVEAVEEERIETICSRENVESVLQHVKAVHPYEEPAIDIYPLLNSGA